ncbi:hypothetical protein DAEQUDRAFT_730861 [Daedalea quercina L-15889]|uniref:Uncharacterized protein n=1 Tax=Daedalea quercina L-15889 TaxID=1314783 RepID=A0A165MPA8_9APHY|nr:hypothetical protein DAEQUDRAFT_730861 [Daedalea quercina L-15889]
MPVSPVGRSLLSAFKTHGPPTHSKTWQCCYSTHAMTALRTPSHDTTRPQQRDPSNSLDAQDTAPAPDVLRPPACQRVRALAEDDVGDLP